jgi:hypothetical protein
MDARGLLLEIARRTRRQLAETHGARATIFFQATEPTAPWSLIPFDDSPAVTEIASTAVVELGEIAIEAFDHLPPAIRGAVRPYRHDPVAAWSRVVGVLVEPQGKIFGSPDPFCGRREFAFTCVEAVAADAAERLAGELREPASVPPAAPPAESAVVVPGKRTNGHRRRGRPPKAEDEDRVAVAASWYENALDCEDEEMRSAILQGDNKPAAVYEAAKQHGLELRRSAIVGNMPPVWPTTEDGEPAPTWKFQDYAVDVSKDAFVRYMARHKSRTGGKPVAKPARTVAAGKVEPDKKPTAATMREKALQRAHDALLAVVQDIADESRWAAVETAMAKAGIDGDFAKAMLAGRDQSALIAAGKHIAKLTA